MMSCVGFSFRHPDKNKDPKAEDMFIKISKSYEVGESASQHAMYFIEAAADTSDRHHVLISV